MASNRDEFYKRDTRPLHAWDENNAINAGRDLEGGGTWMGINRDGRFAALTNYRDPKNIKENAPSRGDLVSKYLLNNYAPLDYMNEIADSISTYNGFNLLIGNKDELFYLSNYAHGIKKLEPGLYGLSNGLLDSDWPKVEKGKIKFAQLFQASIPEIEEVYKALFDPEKAKDEHLPNTGVSLDMERDLSSMLIRMGDRYGTRCSNYVGLHNDNSFFFHERTFDVPANTYTDRSVFTTPI